MDSKGLVLAGPGAALALVRGCGPGVPRQSEVRCRSFTSTVWKVHVPGHAAPPRLPASRRAPFAKGRLYPPVLAGVGDCPGCHVRMWGVLGDQRLGMGHIYPPVGLFTPQGDLSPPARPPSREGAHSKSTSHVLFLDGHGTSLSAHRHAQCNTCVKVVMSRGILCHPASEAGQPSPPGLPSRF